MQATGHCNTEYQVLCFTPAAKQKSMSLEDNQNIHQSISCKLEFGRRVRGGEVGGLKELHSGAAHDMSKRGDSGPFGSAVRDGSGGFHLRQR